MPSNNTPSQHHYNKALHRREFDVFSPDGLICYTVPAGRIAHYGDEGKRMMVCRNYASGGSCPMGAHCKFVHIDVPLNSLHSEAIHTHYVWREPSLVAYECLAPAMAKGRKDMSEEQAAEMKLTIYGPNNRAPAEQLRAGDLLLTVGAERAFAIAMGEREVDTTKASPHPCHCAHYYFNQVCNRGAGCGFVHVISLNPKQTEARVRHSNFHKRLEAMGIQYVPSKGGDDENAAEGESPEEAIASRPSPSKAKGNAAGAAATAKPIRIPKGATIRPASPVGTGPQNATATTAVANTTTSATPGSQSRSRAASFAKKSNGVSYDDITAGVPGGLSDAMDALAPNQTIPTIHVGILPAPQQGPLSVVVGVRAPTPSGFSRTGSQTNSTSNGPMLFPPHVNHERRASDQQLEGFQPSQQPLSVPSNNGQFPIRIPLPAQNGISSQPSHVHSYPASNVVSQNASYDPLTFTSPTQHYNQQLGEDSNRPQLSASANISRRPSNAIDGTVSFNKGLDDTTEELGNVDGQRGQSTPQRFGSNLGNVYQNHSNSFAGKNSSTAFQSVPVASTNTSTNNSFAFTSNAQMPFATPSSTNTSNAPMYSLNIGDLRSEASSQPRFENGLDVNLLKQRDNGAETNSQTPTPRTASHFPNPQNNYTTEAMRFANLRHARNATNASEGGSSTIYNFSASANLMGSNTTGGLGQQQQQQRSHARHGSQGVDMNYNLNEFALSAAATPNKLPVATSPGRYVHNPYGGGGGGNSLGGSMLGGSLAKDRETPAVLSDAIQL